MKQVLAGADVTTTVDAFAAEITGGKACPYTVGLTPKYPKTDMDALVTINADTRVVTVKGGTKTSKYQAFMGKHVYYVKVISQKNKTVDIIDKANGNKIIKPTVTVEMDDTACQDAWAPVFKSNDKKDIVNATPHKVDSYLTSKTGEIDFGDLKADANTAHCKYTWTWAAKDATVTTDKYNSEYSKNKFYIKSVKTGGYGKHTLIHTAKNQKG